jgi:hypothetical protein
MQGKSIKRNLGTIMGGLINNLATPVGGTPYRIFFKGKGTIGD